jgi:hypothetical protein
LECSRHEELSNQRRWFDVDPRSKPVSAASPQNPAAQEIPRHSF